jgi:hypothetical protein
VGMSRVKLSIGACSECTPQCCAMGARLEHSTGPSQSPPESEVSLLPSFGRYGSKSSVKQLGHGHTAWAVSYLWGTLVCRQCRRSHCSAEAALGAGSSLCNARELQLVGLAGAEVSQRPLKLRKSIRRVSFEILPWYRRHKLRPDQFTTQSPPVLPSSLVCTLSPWPGPLLQSLTLLQSRTPLGCHL